MCDDTNNVFQQIGDRQNFQLTSRELLEWCSDTRAFTPTFEPYLMDCLEVTHHYFSPFFGCPLANNFSLLIAIYKECHL